MSDFNSKTTKSVLNAYIRENGLQKAFQDKYKKSYDKGRKDQLLKFIREQQEMKKVEDQVDTIFGDTIQAQAQSQPKEEEFKQQEVKQQEEIPINNKIDDEIDEIPIFTHRQVQSQIAGIDDNIKLNNLQFQARAYIARFPTKLKGITSRPTFKQEFSKLKDPLSKKECEELLSKGTKQEDIDEINRNNRILIDDIERELGSKTSNGMLKDGIFTTIYILENIIRNIRENKDNKYHPMLVSTIGTVNIDNLSAVLDSREDFHDCLDELLIKYSDYNSLFLSLSVEKRLLLIIMFAAISTNSINNEEAQKLKNKKMNPKDPRFKDL